MKRVAIVDIDSTLWELKGPWWEELKKINPDCPCPGTNGNWDFHTGYMDLETALDAAKAVHYRQYDHKPFPYASALLRNLRDNGYYVIIASHRDPGTCGATLRWLSENNMPFDDLFCELKGKEALFDEHNVVLFIDDSPKSLEVAISKGIDCYSIKYDYNAHLASQVVLVDDDEQLLSKIKEYLVLDQKLKKVGL